jgi:hypothetical protein
MLSIENVYIFISPMHGYIQFAASQSAGFSNFLVSKSTLMGYKEILDRGTHIEVFAVGSAVWLDGCYARIQVQEPE